MTLRERIPVGRLGRRIRKAFVAGALFVCTYTAWRLVRDPAWDGWWDAFSWPQLFLYAPVLFFSGAACWQLFCFVTEWLYRLAARKSQSSEAVELQDIQKTSGFWLRDSLRILVLYAAACFIGDIPMVLNYVAAVRKWPMHWWWSSVVDSCLLLMIVVWWLLERYFSRPSADPSARLSDRPTQK
jgi:hypothetical protein